MNDDVMKSLRESAPDYGIELSEQQLNSFRIYLDELWEWNAHFNLTGLSGRRRIVMELFLDSLVPAPFLPQEGKMLDVGSGGGLPGVPLKIYIPRLKTTFLEANSKKVSFLKHVVRLLRLEGTEVVHGRVEKKTAHTHQAGYDLITARALAGLGQTIAWCAPFLSPGGLLVGFLGSRAEKDLQENRAIIIKHRISPHRSIPDAL